MKNKEEILNKFRDKTRLKDGVKTITAEEYYDIVEYLEVLLSKALDQTREETIRDVERLLPPYFDDRNVFNDDYFRGYDSCLRKIKGILNKLKK